MPFLGKVPSQIVDSDVDIDGGTIDGVSIGSVTANAGAFTNLTATGTITFPDDGLSGDDISGGTATLDGLTVDTNTLVVDSTNNRVGIGEASPSLATVHIKGTGDTATYSSVSYEALVAARPSDNLGVALLGANSASKDVLVASNYNGGDLVLGTRTGGANYERVRINGDNGNVGIGETNPLNPLHITVGGSDYATLRLDAPSNVTPATFGIRAHDGKLDIRDFRNSTTPLTINASGDVGIGTASPSALLNLATTATGDDTVIRFDQNGNDWELRASGSTGTVANSFSIYDGNAATERVVISNDGNVGIGKTTGIAGQIHVYGSGASAKGEIRCENVGTGTNNRGIVRVKSATSTYGGGLFYTNNAESSYENNAVHVFNFDNGPLVFGASNAEKARIDASGNLLVNATNLPVELISATSGNGQGAEGANGYYVVKRSSSSAAYYANKTGETTNQATNYIQFRNKGARTGHVDYDGADVAISQYSDERLKENIQDASSGLAIVNDAQVRSFDWKDGFKKSKRFGFVAQELNQVFPDAVKEGGEDPLEDPWTVNEAKFIPVLVKAIQEQQAIIEDLQTRLSALEAN